eukprot:m.1511963 g.1511963  ORF g.1511963 m.1511963 type:complete len:98 (+) comp25211_c1_seq4:39-332(+)
MLLYFVLSFLVAAMPALAAFRALVAASDALEADIPRLRSATSAGEQTLRSAIHAVEEHSRKNAEGEAREILLFGKILAEKRKRLRELQSEIDAKTLP